MQTMTLLEMTQNILSAMNSDEVQSISDTVESLQVAEEIRTTFYELYGNRDLGSFEGLVTLESPGDPTTPHVLNLPSNVSYVRWLKYRDYRTDNEIAYNDLTYLDPEEFIRRIVEQSTTLSGSYVDVLLMPTSSVTFPLSNDRAPKYYTVLQDTQQIVFDAYDATYESTLTGNNSLAWGVLEKEFSLVDGFTPPLDANLFPHFLSEAKSACFITIKEIANSKEEQRARRQLIRSQTRTAKAPGQWKNCFEGRNYARTR